MTDDPRFEERDAMNGAGSSDSEVPEDDTWEPARFEPDGAVRTSPYSIAAFIVSLLGLWIVQRHESRPCSRSW